MSFDEALKADVRRRAHFTCCLCHEIGVEIHHIVPRAEGGPDDVENAAPLCPTCHERYGANPVKRKFIREARDFWYEVCAERYASDGGRIEEIHTAIEQVATKKDIEHVLNEFRAALSGASGDPCHLPPKLGASPISAESLREYLRLMYPTVRHGGQAGCESLAVDLKAIGYVDIDSLHDVVGQTSEPFADIAQDQRDKGEIVDFLTDIWPVRLFLAIWDEAYCKIHYPGVHNKNQDRPGYRWKRPAADNPGAHR